MDNAEIEQMYQLEDAHWWYRSLRDVIARTLKAPQFRLPKNPRVLDAGCGTGANLRLLHEQLRPAYLGGFDLSPDAARLAQSRGIAADIYVSNICDPVFRADDFDLALSCDVLSIAGLARGLAGLRRIAERLKRGGLLILNLPAFHWMRSGHDAAIGTRDRVSAPQVRDFLEESGLGVELLTYRVFALFPMILAARLPSMWRASGRRARSDLRPSFALSDTMLGGILSVENEAILRGVVFPWGSSVYAVARKH